MRPVLDPSDVHRLKHRGAVDADGHVLEDAGLWEHYIEARHRDRALKMKRDENGLEYLEIGGRPSKRTRRGYPATLGRMGQKDLEAFTPHPDKTYAANMPYGACDPAERLELLDAEGLEAAGALSDARHPVGGRTGRRRAEPGLLPRLQPLDRRFLPHVRRPAHPDRASVARRSGGGLRSSSGARVKDGCRGAFVVPFTWSHRAHGDPAHDAVFAKAVELDVPIAIHPAFEPFELRSPRFENGHRLSLLASVTAGEGVRQAFTTFYDFATFDRFPKLKLVLLECGAGWIGYWLDRLDGVATATHLGARAPLKLRPSDYFRRQVWISGDPDERTLPAMMATYGADRFFWASDYPHPDHTGDYLQALEAMADAVPAPARAGLLGGNVRRAFNF